MKKQATVKMKAGSYMVPVKLIIDGRIEFHFPFNKILKDEIKQMRGHKYHGYDETNPRKVWSVQNCERNWFQIKYLIGENPYKIYEKELIDLLNIERKLFKHQEIMVRFGLTRRQCMLACEMGLGKTLGAIEIIERSGITDWFWVGPRSALAAARLEMEKWGCIVQPIFMTYEGLRNDVKAENIWIPQGVIFDESSKIKTPTAQRSQAASILVEEMRKKNPDCFIILMSGSPAPRNPADWWHQLEVACPGFIKEGEYNKFKRRLCITVEKEGPSGTYMEVVTWLDDKRKCKTCGAIPEEHSDPLISQHQWEPSVNEVKKLYKRMNGLVLTQFKKDCLDLPDKHFIRHTVEPSKETLRLLKLIKASATRTITALIQIRELSDGFQYKISTSDKERLCKRCKGSGKSYDYEQREEKIETKRTLISCPKCRGTGRVEKEEREVIEVPCPKDNLTIDLLDEHEPIGRFVIYAGFRASIDRVTKIALRYKWDVIRVDGRGWFYFTEQIDNMPTTDKDMLKLFQSKKNRKICFIGQPGTGGMGITLTESPSIFYYSNTFNAEDRIQTMDRIHRPGMDVNRGAKIIDVIHLPVDEFILDNLDAKMDLQDLSLGKLKEYM